MLRTHLTLSSIAASAILAAPALAQVPPNDDCVNAIVVTEGANGTFDNTGATSSAPTTWPCSTGGTRDIWFSYTPNSNGVATISTCGGTFDSVLEVFDGGCAALNSIACNDDFCNLQSQVEFLATASTTYLIRVGSFATTTGTFPLDITLDYGVDLAGSVNALPLGPLGGAFTAGDTLNFNYVDPASNGTGKLSAVVLNIGQGGPEPIGVTAGIPGFDQVWAGSTPTGFALPFALIVLPAADQTLFIPNNAFAPADTIRLQGVILDPANAPGSLPVVPTRNTVEFVAYGPSLAAEGFEGWTAGGPPYLNGWTDGGGTLSWLVDSAGTPSGGTGPSAAFEGSNYLYCEASSPATTGNTWILNSASFPSAGLSAVAFQLSRVGDSIGTLEVRMGDGLGSFPTVLGTFSGMGYEWEPVVISLGAMPPANVQFQFHYTYGGGFRGDIAIDDFQLQ